MTDKNIYVNDLIHRYPSHTFTEVTVNSETKVTFKDAGSVVIAERQDILAIDAYEAIRQDLLLGESLQFLSSTTERDALTSVQKGRQICNTTSGATETWDGSSWSNAAGSGFVPTWQTRASATVTTTNTTQTTIDSFTLDDNEIYLVQIHVVGVKSDGSDRGGFIKTATVFRDGGGATITAPITIDHKATSDNSYDADITVSGNDVRASVTGVASTTVNWKCFMQFIER